MSTTKIGFVASTFIVLSTELMSGFSARGDLIINIKPDSGSVVWDVRWDALDENSSPNLSSYPQALTLDYDALDPTTGDVLTADSWGDYVRYVFFHDVGDAFSATYFFADERAFGDGVGGVVSSPSGWGVSPDNDGAFPDSNVAIINTELNATDPFPTNGSFILTVPGANIGNYNIGLHSNNPFVTIIIVPEPSSFLLCFCACAVAIITLKYVVSESLRRENSG